MAIGEMGNSPAGWGDVPTDACARGGAETTGLDNMSLGMF